MRDSKIDHMPPHKQGSSCCPTGLLYYYIMQTLRGNMRTLSFLPKGRGEAVLRARGGSAGPQLGRRLGQY